MNKKHDAVVLEIDGVVEEAVLLLVNGVVVRCFASYCPFKIEVGMRYEVEFELVLPDNAAVLESQDKCPKVTMIDNGFSCVLVGFLDGAVIRSFVDFSDEEIHYEHPQLNDKFIEVRVDRIDVAF